MNPLHLRVKRAAAGLMVSLGLACCSTVYAAAALDLPATRQQANSLLRLGKYDEAIDLYRQITAADPGVASLDDLMWAYWNAERFDEAKWVAQRILMVKPGDPDALQVSDGANSAKNRDLIPALRAKAIAEFQQQKYAESAKIYEEIVRQDPKDFLARRDLMWAYWRQGKYSEAVDRAHLVLALRPLDSEALDVIKTAPIILERKNMEALYAEAKKHLGDNQYETAITIFQKLIKMDEKNTAYRHQLLSALIKTGHYEEAVQVGRELTILRKEDYSSWNSLARAQVEVRQSTSALDSYQQSLTLNPKQPDVIVAIARIHLTLRDFDISQRLIQDLQVSTTLPAGAYPVMGEALFWTNHFNEALPYWSKAVELFPGQAGYKYYNAWTQSFIPGQEDMAREKMHLLVVDNHDRRAINFLIDDALSHGRTAAAIQLMEDWLKDLEPKESLVLRLATIYLHEEQWEPLDKLLDRYLQVYPESQTAWLIKATVALHDKKLNTAEKACRTVLEINPSDQDGHLMLADVLAAEGRVQEATRSMEKYWSLNPTNPPSLLMYAQYLYDSQGGTQARILLQKWLKENEGSAVLPVFLYHGLTNHPQDPMLAFPFHHYIGIFDDQIRALHDEGYTPVTAEDVNAWLRREKPLPSRPVLVTFDDGRTDSFVLADPVLKKYGFKATMMSALVNIEGHPYPPPGYASWDHIKEYQSTGRWEIQAHGDLAHIHIPITASGVQGLYLVNRQWLDSTGRLETVDEWKARIEGDYQSVQQKILAHLGSTPTAFAYPEGAYGQKDDNCNVPESAEVNQALVKKYFQAAYVQDAWGMNLQSQDRGRMNRVEPNNAWTGPDLIRHLQDNNPFSRAYKQLIDWATWDGRTREAYGWLARLKASGASPETMLAKEAQIRLYAGDFATGQAQAQQALSSQNFPDLTTTLMSVNEHGDTAWSPSYAYQRDTNGRKSWQVNQDLFISRKGNIQYYATQRHAEYLETGFPTVVDNALGVGAELNLGLYHQANVTALQHLIAGANNDFSAAIKLDSRWTDEISSRFEFGRSPLTNARALSGNIIGTYGVAGARWVPDDLWKFSVDEEWTSYSDSNRRTNTQAEADRVLFANDRFRLKGIDQITYDDARDFSPTYYTPRRLRMNALGPEVTYNVHRRMKLTLRYLPAYAVEDGTNSHFVNEAQAGLEVIWNNVNSLRPSYTRYDTPAFHGDVLAIELTQHF